MRRIITPLAVIALLACIGLGACADSTLASGTIRGSGYALDDLTGRLLGVDHGTRIRYDGAKRSLGFRVLAEGPDGEVVGVKEMGAVHYDQPLHLDGVAVTTLQGFSLDGKDRQLVTVRFAERSGSRSATMSTFVEEFFPIAAGGYGSSWSLESVEVGEDQGLPIHTVSFANGRGELRVEFYVE